MPSDSAGVTVGKYCAVTRSVVPLRSTPSRVGSESLSDEVSAFSPDRGCWRLRDPSSCLGGRG
eukprot:1329896-Pyramimonas_sp.AAC.1